MNKTMDLSIERDSTAIGSLFQFIINDLKVSYFFCCIFLFQRLRVVFYYKISKSSRLFEILTLLSMISDHFRMPIFVDFREGYDEED